MKLGLPLSDDYCYCGAGFYQDIWQRILGKAVEISVTKSILRGDEVCQFELKV
jgi:predicted hydrocarbon binding protein